MTTPEPQPDVSPPKRPWFQFSLRALLGLVLLTSVILSGLAWFGFLPQAGLSERGYTRYKGDWLVTTFAPPQGFWPRYYVPEQSRLVFGLHNRSPQLWDTKAVKRIAILYGPRGVDSCGVSSDGSQLATADEFVNWDTWGNRMKTAHCLRIWDLATGSQLRTFEIALPEKIVSYCTDWKIQWLDTHRILLEFCCRHDVFASFAQVLAIFDPRSGKIMRMTDPISMGEDLLLSPDRKRAAVGHEYGVRRRANGETEWSGLGTTMRVDLVDLDNLGIINTLDNETSAWGRRSILARVWSIDSKWIVAVREDHVVRVWDADTGKPVSNIKGHTGSILSVCFSPNGRTLLTASDDGTARIWDVATGRQLCVLSGHISGLNRAVFNGNGEHVLTASEDKTARLWEATTGKQLHVWPEHESAVRDVAFVQDGKEIWTRTVRGRERRWSIVDGSLIDDTKCESLDRRRYGVLFLRDDGNNPEVWVGPPGAPGEVIEQSSSESPDSR